jgi:hypothetical protein
VGMKIIGDNFLDFFQPPAQVLPVVDFTYLSSTFDMELN